MKRWVRVWCTCTPHACTPGTWPPPACTSGTRVPRTCPIDACAPRTRAPRTRPHVRLCPWNQHLHSHVTDDILSDWRLQKGSQDLERMQEGVRLVIMVPAPVAAAEEGNSQVRPGDILGRGMRAGTGAGPTGQPGQTCRGATRQWDLLKASWLIPLRKQSWDRRYRRGCISREMKKPQALSLHFRLL